jgi:hypothetical protein
VPQPERFTLADIGKPGHMADISNHVPEIELVSRLKKLLQFPGPVEIVFDGPFPSPRDEHDVLAAGANSFFDAVMNDWFVDGGSISWGFPS